MEPRTQPGWLLHALDITLIAAHSPQAKGQVERLFQTLQDRLVKALRRAGAGNAAQANAILPAFLRRFNQRFSQSPAQPDLAFRPPLSPAEANELIHFTYWRTVANDHAISLFGHVIALPSLPLRLNLAGRHMALHHRMDGRLAVVYQEHVLGLLQPAQPDPPRLEQFVPAPQYLPCQPPVAALASLDPLSTTSAIPTAPGPVKPSPDHPWRKGWRSGNSRKKIVLSTPQNLPEESR